MADSRKMEPTRYDGVFKRTGPRGDRWVYIYYADGKQRRGTAKSEKAAVRLRRQQQRDADEGQLPAVESRATFREFAAEWVERYRGARGHGIRDSTRENYRGDLERYAFRSGLGDKRLTRVRRGDVERFVQWLEDEPRALGESSVNNALKPVRGAFDAAVADRLIRENPATGIRASRQEVVVDDEGDSEVRGEFAEDTRAFSRKQLGAFLAIVHPRYQLLFEFLALTGLRVSEARALQWRHLILNGERPQVLVRRQYYRGQLGALKSRRGRREVPLDVGLTRKLRAAGRGCEPKGLVFANIEGGYFSPGNIRRRHLKPMAEEVGAPWAGFHSFRHTCASLLFDGGANVVRVQRWLGHSTPRVTLDTYAHLLDDNLGEGLTLTPDGTELDNELGNAPGDVGYVREPSETPGLAQLTPTP